MLVLDGLGGLAAKPSGGTELETASTPHLDRLAEQGICGLHMPVGPGVTPGSGPGHLALFGYDPVQYQVGRGVLSALGIQFELRPDDIAVRGNFCRLDDDGIVVDRRAGRLDTSENRRLCAIIDRIQLDDVEVFVHTIEGHRFLVVFRGAELGAEVNNSDPGRAGVRPRPLQARNPGSQRTADVASEFVDRSREILEGEAANGVLLRGFGKRPSWPSMEERYRFKAAAAASYPMYRGVAELLGMVVFPTEEGIGGALDVAEREWNRFDFWFMHDKRLDSAGEDGDFAKRVELLEEIDSAIPRLRALEPDVLVITGDHSTPALLAGHSWHPVPTLLWARNARTDGVFAFSEKSCVAGGLGPRFPATSLMPLLLGHAERLDKFGP